MPRLGRIVRWHVVTRTASRSHEDASGRPRGRRGSLRRAERLDSTARAC